MTWQWCSGDVQGQQSVHVITSVWQASPDAPHTAAALTWLTRKWLQLNISANDCTGRSNSREPSRQRRCMASLPPWPCSLQHGMCKCVTCETITLYGGRAACGGGKALPPGLCAVVG